MAKTKIHLRPSEGPDEVYGSMLEYGGIRDLLDCPNIVSFKIGLLKSIEEFTAERESVEKAINKAQNVFRAQPVLSAYLLWSEVKRSEDPRNFAKIILEHELIPFKDRQGGLLLVKDVDQALVTHSLEMIRCRSEFDLWRREMLVLSAVSFYRWLSSVTFGASFWKIEDPDDKKTQGRVLAYDAFIPLLARLDDRCRLVAKLLYFGGSRTLDQVLKLKLEDVDFDKQMIRFGTQLIDYPLHVFKDIRDLVGDQVSGPVFSGRQGSSLNPATVFRNFKEAASQIGLGDSFSPKTLTTNC